MEKWRRLKWHWTQPRDARTGDSKLGALIGPALGSILALDALGVEHGDNPAFAPDGVLTRSESSGARRRE